MDALLRALDEAERAGHWGTTLPLDAATTNEGEDE